MNVREQALYKLCEFDDDGERDPILEYISVLESIIIEVCDAKKMPTVRQEEILNILFKSEN